MQHLRAAVGFILAWIGILVGWLHILTTLDALNTLDTLLRIALSGMGIVSAYYATRYYRRNSK
ncbi:MAG: hypothetical protein ACRES6_09345 [Steroidobacteraceae bacterium]